MKNTITENIDENKFTIPKQREKILELNNDIVYWVYNQLKSDKWEIKFQMLNNSLTCYPDKLETLNWLEENSDIIIIDTNELRKWKFKILSWKNPDYPLHWINENGDFKVRTDSWSTMNVYRNLKLLSSWVIELVKVKNIDWKEIIHTYTQLRDWNAVDALQRSWVAGRNSYENLNEEIERE